MSFSEKVGAHYQRASNSFHNFAVSAKESFAKVTTYISETATKVYNAILPHFQRFKETSVTFVKENKTGIGLVAIGLAIGATITAAIACLFKSKSQEASKTSPPETTKNPEPKKAPAGGVQVLPSETPVPLKKAEPAAPLKAGSASTIPTAPAPTKDVAIGKILPALNKPAPVGAPTPIPLTKEPVKPTPLAPVKV
jgi:hypothetical protein